MRQRPDAVELERLADRVLREAPLPEDPKARSYEQRMALKALSVARRGRERAKAEIAAELDAFARLYGGAVVRQAGDSDETRVAALNRRLAAEIRNGDWDAAPDALKALLMTQVRARLRRSNPRYLEAALGEQHE